MFIEKSGKTVEDAVQAGLKELGKESSEVSIEVLEYGSPGLFGMFGRLARVRLTVKENEEIDFEMPVFSLNQQPAKRAKPAPKQEAKPAPKAEAKPTPKVETKPAPKVETKPTPKAEAKPQPDSQKEKAAFPVKNLYEQEKAQVKEDEKVQKPVPRPRRPRPVRSEQPEEKPVSAVEEFPPLKLDELSDDAKSAYEFIRELTHLMNVDVEIRMRESGGHLQVQMIGDTLGVLIGRRGATLDALQYLTSLQVNKGREEYLRVTLDTEHYREKREVALQHLAERMANRARRTGHRVALEPMNPYERRILHSTLQDNPYVTTHSEGEEPYRRVVITLK